MRSATSDVDRNARLAFTDPRLPGLAWALDPDAAARLYARRCAEGASALVRPRRIHDVVYEPRRRCRVAHAFAVTTSRGGARETIAVVDVRPEGVEVRTVDEDPALPLGSALDPARAAPAIGAALGCDDAAVSRIDVIRYRPGSRCTARYDLRRAGRHRRVFGKVSTHHGGHLLDAVRAIGRQDVGAHRSPIADPIAWCQALQMVLLRPVGDGGSLHAIAFGSTRPSGTRILRMRAAGATLARLHAMRAPQLPTRRLADDVAALERSAAALASCDPGSAGAFDALRAALDDIAGEPATLVPSHGAVRTDQFLVDGGDVVLVDLDGLCRADPARDIGNLLAYLRWKAIRQPQHRRFIATATRAFLGGYREVRALPDEALLTTYTVASMLKIAGRRFRRLDFAEWPLVPRLLDEAHARLAAVVSVPAATGTSAAAPSGRDRRGGPTPRAGRGGSEHVATSPPDDALDADAMRAHLLPLLAGPPDAGARRPPRGPADVPSSIVSVTVLASRPGRRWTIRYAFDAGPEVIGKLYVEPGRGRSTLATMRWLRGTGDGDGLPGVPRPLGWIPGLGMLVYEPVPGDPLSEVLRRASADRQGSALEETAGWLHDLHRRPPEVSRVFEPARELDTVTTWAITIGRRHPDLGADAERHASALIARSMDLLVRSPVPIHKDFHPGHVFVGDRVAVVDFDELRIGDREFDVAHFCAYLELLAREGPASSRAAEAMCGRFVDAYEGREPLDRRRFATFLDYARLKIAWQLSTGALSWRTDERAAFRDAASTLRSPLVSTAPRGSR